MMFFQLSGCFLPTLVLLGTIAPKSLAADDPLRSNLPTKSDYRCGASEPKARTNCGKLCVYNTDCKEGEYCWGTAPNKCYVNEISTSETTATTPPPSKNPITFALPNDFTSSSANLGPLNPKLSPRADYRCGIDEEDSRSNCGKVCIYNSDCKSDEYCWSTFPNMCFVNDSQVVPPSTSNPVELISNSTNEPNPTNSPIEAITAPIDITLTPNIAPVMTPTQPPTTRVPASEAPVKPPTLPQVESPPVLSSSPTSKPIPRSDFRCGVDEEDSRTNCGKVCVFISDCAPGEYCWSTFPNTCYIDDFLNDLLIGGVPVDNDSPISSIPITDDTPVTANPTTLRPTTSAPSTSAPITSSPTTSAPITSSPTTSSPVTPAPTTSEPTTLEPITSTPVMTTSVPITVAPVTLAPIVAANPVISPDTVSCPEIPPNGCSICGENKCVGKLDAIFEFPDQPAVPCSILEKAGYDGLIPPNECPMLPPLIGACECVESTPIKPTLAPVNPTSSPVEPTSAPIISTSAPISLAPVKATLAPVNPTIAPIEPTSSPVAPTLAPVEPTLTPVMPTMAPVEITSGTINFDPTNPPFVTLTEFEPRSDFRCGADEEDSRINCGRLCTFNSDCKSGEYCWSTFPNTCYANNLQPFIPNQGINEEDLGPISDYRCGSSEADARGNCKNKCTTQEDCQIGEYCWPTLPNYCHRAGK